jgi:hypothetical protein
MIDDECEAFHGIRIGRGNLSTRRKTAPVPLCPQYILYELSCDETQAAAMGRRPELWHGLDFHNYSKKLDHFAQKLLSGNTDIPHTYMNMTLL